MKNKRWKILSVISLCIAMSAMPVLAEQAYYFDGIQIEEGDVVFSARSVGMSEGRVTPRDTIIALANVSISNAGGGAIGVYVDTSCYVPVDKIRMRVYLDVLNEKEERWEQVTYYDFESLASDHPDQDMVDATVAFQIKGKPTERYYRLRSVHSVTLGTKIQGAAARTDGVKITQTP